MTAPGALDASGLDLIDLEVEGMTCAACAARIEKKLNRLDGVTATVNYATEKASVRFDGDRYLVALDGRTVLERAVSDVYPGRPPLAVSGVGILANWEWGDDSGSLVRYFRASRLRRAGKER